MDFPRIGAVPDFTVVREVQRLCSLKKAAWCFGTMEFYDFPETVGNGMSSSQLIFRFFQRGRYTTNQIGYSRFKQFPESTFSKKKKKNGFFGGYPIFSDTPMKCHDETSSLVEHPRIANSSGRVFSFVTLMFPKHSSG